MKWKILFTTIFIISIHSINAQWYQVNTNTTENLYDIFFVDSLEGYCVGGSDDWGAPQSTGVILKTTDGGDNWNTVFSKDSLTIKNIAVVDVFGNDKLYAYGLKNGASHLVSTVVNIPFQNWSVTSINYLPQDVVVHDNSIFYIDFNDGHLNKLTNSVTTSLGNTEKFNISSSCLLVIKSWSDDSLYCSFSFDSTYHKINNHSFPSVFGQNQSTNSVLKKNGDTLILKGTYPSAVVFSENNGVSWNYNYGGGEAKSVILETSQIISMNVNANSSELLLSNDFGQNWNEDTINGVVFLDIGYSKHNNSAFALGENGIVYKNSFLTTVGFNETGGLKKKINIYPNPTKDILQIETAAGIAIEQIELFNISGKKLKVFGKNEATLKISGLNSGMYVLKLTTNEGTLTKKVFIE